MVSIAAVFATTVVVTCLLLTCCFRESNAHESSEGTCLWSGDAPMCGNGGCPDDNNWYAIGENTIDKHGNECAAGVRNLYCCPKTRKLRPIIVKFCSDTNHQGNCVEINKTDTECVRLPKHMLNNVNSASTFGGCVRVYDGFACHGDSIALRKGNSANHNDLVNLNFEYNVESVGPCLRNDFCAPENACRFPVEEFCVGCYNQYTTTRKSNLYGGPVSFYRIGHADRTEAVVGTLEFRYLDTGTRMRAPNSLVDRLLSLKTDVVGMILPARLGGSGIDPQNFFPVTSNPSIHTALKTYEDIIYELVKKHGNLHLWINVHYKNRTDMRPNQIVYRVYNSSDWVFFQDSVPNPSVAIVGTEGIDITPESTIAVPSTASDSSNTALYYIIPGIVLFILGMVPLLVFGARKLMARKDQNMSFRLVQVQD